MNRPTDPPSARAFLDATVLYAAAIGGGCSKLWALPGVRLVTSEYAAREAWFNLIKEPDPDAARLRLVDLLGPPLELTSTGEPDPKTADARKLRDPKDVPILHGAIQANCSHLLTADGDCFGPYFGRTLAGVMVLKPGKFLALHGL